MGLLRLFFAGGIVMWPLLAASLLVVTLVLERSRFWWQIHQQQATAMRHVLKTYAETPQVAIEALQQQRHLPLARIFLAALTLDQATPDEFRLALESAAQAELPLLKRFNTLFDTVIGAAPLLGLLGTILGLIGALSSIDVGDVGGEGTVMVTAGIGEALVSTAFGLMVALLALLFANLFQGLYRRQRSIIEDYTGRLELIYRGYYRRYLARARDLKSDPMGR